MSRSGYDDYEGDCTIPSEFYRMAVQRAAQGKRGQKLLSDLLTALDAMPVKRLIANEFSTGGEVCALGAVAPLRGVDVADLDPEDDYYTPRLLSKRFDIAESLAREVMYANDEGGPFDKETPEQRWQRMRDWVASQIKATA